MRGTLLFGVLAIALVATTAQAKTVTFRWEKVPGAARYEIQVATDLGFANVTTSEKTVEAYFRGDVPEKIHFWRVRAIDGDGVPGVFSPPRFIHGTVPSPSLGTPSTNSRFKEADTAIQLSWTGSPLVAQYIVEIGRSADLSKPLKSKRTTATQYSYKHRGPGTYYWRVAALDLNGDSVNASGTRSFEVTAAPVAKITPTPMPKVTATPVPNGTPAVNTTPRPWVVDAGVGVGVFSNFGGITAARPKLEVGVQPWHGRPLRLSLEAAFLSTSISFEDSTGSLAGSSRLQAYPVAMNASYRRPWRQHRVYATAGLFVTPITATVDVPTQPQFRESSISGGACLAVGAERSSGLFAELGYAFGTPVNGLVRASPNGMLLSVGYRKAVWPR